MALTSAERKEIEEIVRTVFVTEWRNVSYEITAGFVEAIDWYSNNLAQIMEEQNAKSSTWVEQMKAKIEAKVAERRQSNPVSGFGR